VALNQFDRRLELHLQGLRHWINTPNVTHIVICDGSNYDLTPHIKNLRCNNPKVLIECLHFQNELSKVIQYGIGFGEGEIIKYALNNSKFLSHSRFFVKCTGKLWVKNFSECLKSFNGIASFDYQGKIRPQLIDTRFYIVNKIFYKTFLSEAYKNCRDKDFYYLEHSYRDELAKIMYLYEYIMLPIPLLLGTSGHHGENYKIRYIKTMIRNIRALIIKFLKLKL